MPGKPVSASSSCSWESAMVNPLGIYPSREQSYQLPNSCLKGPAWSCSAFETRMLGNEPATLRGWCDVLQYVDSVQPLCWGAAGLEQREEREGFCWKFGSCISWCTSLPNPCVSSSCSPLSLPMHNSLLDALSLDAPIYPLPYPAEGEELAFLCLMPVVHAR